MLYRGVERHLVTQWGFAKGYCVMHLLHRPLWQGLLHNIV